MVGLFISFIGGLCWGSFLNVIASRLVRGSKLFTLRSACSSCKKVIAWYDNIPLLSWLVLRARCRSCATPISWLYPFTELMTAVVLTATIYRTLHINLLMPFFDINIAYVMIMPHMLYSAVIHVLFMSALIAATRTDLEAMVIPQLFTVWLIPLGLAAAYFDLTCISLTHSALGALLGYGLLWVVAFAFKRATGKDGVGEGDMELLALIGSFLGPLGVWFSLMIGSLSGLVLGTVYLLLAKKQRSTRIPFGPFLALGAVLYFFFYPTMIATFFSF